MDNQMMDPRYLAMIQAGLGILAGNNGRQPVGATIGQGLLGGVAGYQQNLQAQQEAEMRKQQLDMHNQQFGWQKEKYDAEKQKAEQQKTLLNELGTGYGIDPRVLSAYPSIGENVIKNKLIPKDPELMIAPNGVAINKNDPTNIGKTFIKPEDSEQNPNRPFMMVGGQIVPNKAYQDYEIAKQRAGAPSTSVSVGGTQVLPEKFTDKLNMMAAENLMGQHGEAKNASTAVAAVKDAMTLLDKGMFTGKAAGLQESMAGWYQAATGREIPKLDSTQQFKTVIGDIVLPALSSLKGASSDRDFIKIEEYSRGEATMTESALRNHLNRLYNKYGAQIKNYNKSYSEYSAKGEKLPGIDEIPEPSGNIATDKIIMPRNEQMPPVDLSKMPKSVIAPIGGKKVPLKLGADGLYYDAQGNGYRKPK